MTIIVLMSYDIRTSHAENWVHGGMRTQMKLLFDTILNVFSVLSWAFFFGQFQQFLHINS